MSVFYGTFGIAVGVLARKLVFCRDFILCCPYFLNWAISLIEIYPGRTSVFIGMPVVSFLFVSILVLLVLVCIKRDLWNRMIKSRFRDRWDREGLFEQEERFDRKRKHKKKLGNKAQKFAEKYQLNDSSTFLYSP